MSLDATKWAWEQKGLTQAEKLVLLSLADRAGEDHTAWPSARRLAEDTELSDRHVRRVLHELVNKGKIRPHGAHPSGVIIYQLVGVKGREDNQFDPPDKLSGGADKASRRGDKLSGGTDSRSPKPPIEPTHESKPLTPPNISPGCIAEASGRFRGYSIEFLETEWQKSVVKKGELPNYPDKAFIGWATKYVQNHPL